MKNYLLDTQVFLWMQNEPEKLSKNLNRHLRAKDIRWHLSQITIWEIQVKYDLGKLYLPTAPKDCIPEVIEKAGLAYQPLQDEAIFMLGKLPAINRDPFDRLLAATSIVNGWTLATVDSKLKEYPLQTIS